MEDRDHITMRATLASAPKEDRALFERVRDAIGSTATYVGREILGDIRNKLIDEAWFGRPAASCSNERSTAPGEFWRGTKSITIEGELSRETPRADSPDLTHER